MSMSENWSQSPRDKLPNSSTDSTRVICEQRALDRVNQLISASDVQRERHAAESAVRTSKLSTDFAGPEAATDNAALLPDTGALRTLASSPRARSYRSTDRQLGLRPPGSGRRTLARRQSFTLRRRARSATTSPTDTWRAAALARMRATVARSA